MAPTEHLEDTGVFSAVHDHLVKLVSLRNSRGMGFPAVERIVVPISPGFRFPLSIICPCRSPISTSVCLVCTLAYSKPLRATQEHLRTVTHGPCQASEVLWHRRVHPYQQFSSFQFPIPLSSFRIHSQTQSLGTCWYAFTGPTVPLA